MELVPVLHNVSSVQRLVDTAKLVYGLGLKMLVATRVYGAAAQSGIPEAMRIALRNNAGLVILQDIPDAIDAFKPDVILIVSQSYAKEHLDPLNPPIFNGRVLVVFNGGDPDFSSNEITYGQPVYIKGLNSRVGPLAEAALILYGLLYVRKRGEASLGR